jgi:hypothetical protein
MKLEIYLENDYISRGFINHYRPVEISYQMLDLCQAQHTFVFVVAGLGFSVTWFGEVDEKCKKRLDRDLWYDKKRTKSKRRV